VEHIGAHAYRRRGQLRLGCAAVLADWLRLDADAVADLRRDGII
jgi:hypothetical protein